MGGGPNSNNSLPQINNKNPVHSGSGLGSPTKKIRKVGESDPETKPAEILFLLEKKKKGVKKDGLYKFVLWREALRDEKNKVCLSSWHCENHS